jgi:hypothetical protein
LRTGPHFWLAARARWLTHLFASQLQLEPMGEIANRNFVWRLWDILSGHQVIGPDSCFCLRTKENRPGDEAGAVLLFKLRKS